MSRKAIIENGPDVELDENGNIIPNEDGSLPGRHKVVSERIKEPSTGFVKIRTEEAEE